MANTLTAVIPQLLAQGLLALRENSITARLVNRSYEREAGKLGSTIDVPVPSAIAATAVSPANTPPATPDVAPTSVPIALDQWYEAAFQLSDKEQLEVMSGTIPMQASEAIKALANNVDNYLLGLYVDFYGYHGTAGTAPFGVPGVGDATDIRKVLNQQLAPMNDRHCILDPTAEAKALGLREFADSNFSGSVDAMLKGQLNQKLGFRWWMNQNVPLHTAGSITTGLVAKAATAQAIGDKTIVCTTAASTGAMAFNKGDIISFAGHDQTYVVTQDVTEGSASTDVTVNVEPGLKTALAGSEAVTLRASHRVNLAFQRDAIAFATRPLQTSVLSNQVMSRVDPVSGLALRLEVSREHKRDRFSFDILYGAKVIRRELGARLAG